MDYLVYRVFVFNSLSVLYKLRIFTNEDLCELSFHSFLILNSWTRGGDGGRRRDDVTVIVKMGVGMPQLLGHFSLFLSCHCKQSLLVTFVITEVIGNCVNPVKWLENGRKLC
jgi:hypothetical protein